jgi:hypothetical protein
LTLRLLMARLPRTSCGDEIFPFSRMHSIIYTDTL